MHSCVLYWGFSGKTGFEREPWKTAVFARRELALISRKPWEL
jgi:hypothetical protein